MLPTKALDEAGSLNECKKAYCKVPYFVDASSDDLSEIEKQLAEAIPLLYEAMLSDPGITR